MVLCFVAFHFVVLEAVALFYCSTVQPVRERNLLLKEFE